MVRRRCWQPTVCKNGKTGLPGKKMQKNARIAGAVFFLTANYANYSKLAQVFSGHRIMRIMLVLVEYRTSFSTASERLNLNNPKRTQCSLGIESLHTISTASERLNLNCFWHISESASHRDAIGGAGCPPPDCATLVWGCRQSRRHTN